MVVVVSRYGVIFTPFFSVIIGCFYVADNTTTSSMGNVPSLASGVSCNSRYGGTFYSSS